MSGEPDFYRPAEACRIAEVAPYVLRYWETEFPALSDGKEKGAARLYTGRDVKVIRRIRELLYDEGFTVAGAKKRLEAEISEGRFEDGLEAAPSPAVQKKPASSAAAPAPSRPSDSVAPIPVTESGETAFLTDAMAPPPPAKRATASTAPSAAPAARATGGTAATGGAGATGADFPDRKRVVKELKEIVKLLDRSGRKTR